MRMIDPLLQEFDYECGQTRKTLERVPDSNWDWKPHAKSMSMQQLAGHLAEIPQWVEATCSMDVFEMNSEAYKPFLPETHGALLASFDENVAQAREILDRETDEHLLQSWTMKVNGDVLFSLPRIAVLRSFILSHSIHHRAQLTVYLRLNDVPVPSLYGPSADEAS